jgi:phosphatidylinositol glycan class F
MKTNATTSPVKASAEPEAEVSASSHSISAAEAIIVHLISGLGLGLGLAVLLARNVFSVSLVSHPSLTLRLIWVKYLSFIYLSFFLILPSNLFFN